MVEFVILNIRPFQNLLFMLVVISQLDLLKLCFFLCLSFRLNRVLPILYRLSGLILISFKGNIIFMMTSRSLKMLKILIEVIVQVFHDKFSRLFVFNTSLKVSTYFISI